MASMPPRGYCAETETVIKRSRFITTVARSDSEVEARALIAKVRSRYPDANHHCSAFRLADAGVETARSSDDGEPAGTAGVPILGALVNAGLVNLTAVVSRYFGGIKLGAGGLTRAYAGCVSEAVVCLPRVVRVKEAIWTIHLPHAQAGRFQTGLARAEFGLVESSYDQTGVQLWFTAPGDPNPTVARLSQGELTARLDRVEIVEKPVT